MLLCLCARNSAVSMAGKALQLDMWRLLPNILLCRLAASSLIQSPISKILSLVLALGTDCLNVFLPTIQPTTNKQNTLHSFY